MVSQSKLEVATVNKLLVTKACTTYHKILQFKIVAGSWLASTLVSPYLPSYVINSNNLEHFKANLDNYFNFVS